MRDTQRMRVWRAVRAISKTPLTPHDAERLAAKTWRSKRVRNNWRHATGRELPTLPAWAKQSAAMVLFQLARTINGRDGSPAYRATHGWEFCAIFLKLVLYMLGREAHDTVKASFKTHKVRFTKPRKKRELTEEEKDVLRARLKGEDEKAVRARHWLDELAGIK